MDNLTTKLPIILFTIVFILIIGCKDYSTSKDARISFQEMEYDLGVIPNKQDTECTIEFNNPGEAPLIILDIKTSCGCTIPEWPKKPIKSGRKETLIIKYRSSHAGRFSKTITVFYNGEESPAKLVIKGEVESSKLFTNTNI
jgi:hypothetical protein